MYMYQSLGQCFFASNIKSISIKRIQASSDYGLKFFAIMILLLTSKTTSLVSFINSYNQYYINVRGLLNSCGDRLEIDLYSPQAFSLKDVKSDGAHRHDDRICMYS
jgi:hypothetical protein